MGQLVSRITVSRITVSRFTARVVEYCGIRVRVGGGREFQWVMGKGLPREVPFEDRSKGVEKSYPEIFLVCLLEVPSHPPQPVVPKSMRDLTLFTPLSQGPRMGPST